MKKVQVYLKNIKEPTEISGDRIDILEYEREGVEYYQIRYFRRGFSKSVYIEKDDVKKIIEKE
ncbi:hypothetical protein [Oceanirhabdus sp. W0125-5]|uniref:hypothetical protein n=1 Tax=Oceanirhabdus sp. W0125-5 TaxID=2999116 RepID=UPI0022F2C35F|nr:hypothetical protein [Oceanirhabdus sp. W0125-5]WBW98520.1 hypothetical protein OW730_07090 [Oceanirhabdus sp. W0125-5]